MATTESRVSLIVFVAGALVLTVAAGQMLFSTFMFYDDEGYVLYSLFNFVEHGRLYGGVYSQYGPVPYVLFQLLHAVGLPLTHTAGRVVTLGIWSATAILGAGLVWQMTHRLAAALAVMAALFVYLWVMVSESTHPGGLITLLTAILAVAGYVAIARGSIGHWAATAGLLSSLLLLTKINVGAFAVISAGTFLALHAARPTLRRWLTWLALVAIIVVPFWLMRPLWHADWVRTYGWVYALSAPLVLGAASLVNAPIIRARHAAVMLLCGLAAAIIPMAVVLARGTSMTELLDGIILRPLRHPVQFSMEFSWPAGARLLAVASSVGFATALWGASRGRRHTVDAMVAVLRLGATAGVAVSVLRFPEGNPCFLVFAFGLPSLWLFVWPLCGTPAHTAAAQTWIGLVLLGQFLHGFPVPMSQAAWGTFLMVPLAALGSAQALRWLAENTWPSIGRPRFILFAHLALWVVAIIPGARLVELGRRYATDRDLALPGAERIRLPVETTAGYRALVINLAAHADMVFSLPGMFSFNLWTGLPTPTLANVTHWFSLLTTEQQQAIIQSLDAHPRACIIVQKDHIAFLRARDLAPAGPLYEYIERHFEPAFVLDGFEFRVRKGRTVLPLLTAEVLRRAPETDSADPDTLLNVNVLAPASPVAQVEITMIDDPARSLVLHATNCRVEVTPVTLAGAATAPAAWQAWPLAASGPSILSLYFDRGDMPLDPRRTLIVLRGAAGAELGLIRLRP